MPSLYFTLPAELQATSKVLDFDRKFAKSPGFVFYDFNEPENIDTNDKFDLAVIDPPFITREVWEKYTITAKKLLKPDGKLICSTIAENADMLKELLDVTPVTYLPSIPNLPY